MALLHVCVDKREILYSTGNELFPLTKKNKFKHAKGNLVTRIENYAQSMIIVIGNYPLQF